MFSIGDEFIATKRITGFLNEGDNAKITSISSGKPEIISFVYGDKLTNKGLMSLSEFNSHFKKVTEEIVIPTITMKCVERIIEDSKIMVHTIFGNCTVVTCCLPNGFVITEAYNCTNPNHYDEEIGAEICMNRIKKKIVELETYRLRQEIYDSDYCCGDCDNCKYPCDDEEDEENEDSKVSVEVDMDCNDCNKRDDCSHYHT